LITIALPVGISFFTFQAISYTVDVKRRLIEPATLMDTAIYLSFFPHLVAGPIVRAREFLPQLARPRDPQHVAVSAGLTLIGMGLVKKVVIADYLGRTVVDPVFAVPQAYHSPDVLLAAYSYAAQIYCDFSGYTDIAIGLALLMGFVFPQNFNSPYRATGFRDFWRRWHMTLSRFLRDFLYIPLGGSRGSRLFTYRNLMITMVLGGLWHGAAWTFVAWGALHGAYLCINHAWNRFVPRAPPRYAPVTNLAALMVTFVAVVVAWVFFRADSLSSAIYVVSRMADPTQIAFGRGEVGQMLFIMIYAAIAWFAPNTQAIMGYDHRNRMVGANLNEWLRRPGFLTAAAAALAFGVLGISQHSEFIYFRF
jgi:D-alanyl-lipoteichoic acid acyltransferase DltB (MBOAT superfamily)